VFLFIHLDFYLT